MARRSMLGRKAVSATVLALAALAATAAPALAAGSVTVSQTDGLDPTGQQVLVTGTGFDVEQGIYVSVCVDNGPGQLPTPCLGGVDTEGGSGSSSWISSNPPSYAEGLTIPYGPGGSFEVTLLVVGADPKTGIDCTVVVCSLVTRSDHTATDDRSQDTRTPLTFGAPGSSSEPPSAPSSTSAPPVESAEPSTATATTTPATTAAAAPSASSDATSAAPDDAALVADDDSSGLPATVWVVALVVAAGVATAVVLRQRAAGRSSTSTPDRTS